MIERSPAPASIGRSFRFYAIVATIPFVMGLMIAWFGILAFFLGVLLSPILLLVFVIGGAMQCFGGIQAARRTDRWVRRIIRATTPPIMALLVLLLAWPTLTLGAFTGTWVRLMLNRSNYAQIIERAKRRPPQGDYSGHQTYRGITYVVDAGPPVRVAFNPDGLLDNWSGIIFDPTGQVMAADGFDPVTGKFAAPERITRLFGGDLVSCRALWTDYYTCSFT